MCVSSTIWSVCVFYGICWAAIISYFISLFSNDKQQTADDLWGNTLSSCWRRSNSSAANEFHYPSVWLHLKSSFTHANEARREKVINIRNSNEALHQLESPPSRRLFIIQPSPLSSDINNRSAVRWFTADFRAHFSGEDIVGDSSISTHLWAFPDIYICLYIFLWITDWFYVKLLTHTHTHTYNTTRNSFSKKKRNNENLHPNLVRMVMRVDLVKDDIERLFYNI